MSTRDAGDRLGYDAPIRLGTWQRITRYGAPRMLSYGWLIVCLWVGMMVLTRWGFPWVLGVGVAWALVQGVLVALTQWNVNFDSALLARMRRQYQRSYRAG